MERAAPDIPVTPIELFAYGVIGAMLVALIALAAWLLWPFFTRRAPDLEHTTRPLERTVQPPVQPPVHGGQHFATGGREAIPQPAHDPLRCALCRDGRPCGYFPPIGRASVPGCPYAQPGCGPVYPCDDCAVDQISAAGRAIDVRPVWLTPEQRAAADLAERVNKRIHNRVDHRPRHSWPDEYEGR